MEQKIDRRRHYILVVDTETANTIMTKGGKLDMSDVLFYDCGWAVVDKHGTVYETASYVNRDIFVYERELMQSAYYKDKLPQYSVDIRLGVRKMATTYEIRQAMLDVIKRWGIKHVSAHNARFDSNGLNRTQSWTTTGRFRYWFPFGSDIVWWDTLKMAQDVIVPMPTYIRFCQEHEGYCLKNGKPRATAEILYQFITGDDSFVESHTGLEDVLIEKEILAYCFRQHKAMRKELYNSSGKKFPPQTEFQHQIMASLRECPTIRMGWA